MSIARRRIGSPRDLRGLLRGRNAGYAEDVFSVLERAARKPPVVPPRPRGTRQSPGQVNRLRDLKQWRRSEAERRGVPQPVVLPPTAMQYLAREGCGDLDSVPQLGEKRVRLYGAAFRQICS